MNRGLTATKLRAVLITALIVIIAAASAGFYFGSQYLYNFAIETSKATINATSSNGESAELQKLQQSLAAQQAVIAKTNALFATDSTYQTQVVTDINRYAAAAGLPTPSYSFNNSTTGSSMGGRSSSQKGGLGRSNTSFTVSLPSSVSYNSMLTFLSGIDQNLPKLEVTSIDLKRDTKQGNVTTPALSIQVVVR